MPMTMPIILPLLLRATLLLSLACAAAVLLHRSSAAARHLVWASTLTALLALPMLCAIGPSLSIKVPPEVAAQVAAQVAATVAAPPSALVAPPSTAATNPAPTENLVRPAIEWRLVFGALWAAGALLVLARLALGLTTVHLIARNATPARSPRWSALLAAAAKRLGVRRAVGLRIGPPGAVPVTCGTIHPLIILPPDAESWSDDRLTVVLTHELAHVRRLDVLTHITGQVALAAFWFHPLTWLATTRLRRERERACDDLVLAAGACPSRYAHDLLSLVDALQATPAPPAAALAMARRTEIEGRLVAILDATTRRTPLSARRLATGLGLATATVTFLAAARPVICTAVAVISLPPVRAVAQKLSPAATLANAATAAADLPSDAAKRAALLAIVPRYCGNDTLRVAFFAAAGTISSDTERHRVLTALLRLHHLDAATRAEIRPALAMMEKEGK
jgi:bla regulator protein blaR1